MQISAKTWNEYITRLSRLNQKAGQLMREYIDAHGIADTDGLVAYAYGLVTKYSEGSAELACQMYEALAEAQGVYVPAAEPAATASYGEVARMVSATKDQNPANLPNGISRLVKRAGADTTLKNAIRDGAEWAWVPHGDTCPFCITLASNGWQKASQKLLKGGHAEHIHANCDCEFAVRCGSVPTLLWPGTIRTSITGSIVRRAATSTKCAALITPPTGSASMHKRGRRMRRESSRQMKKILLQ